MLNRREFIGLAAAAPLVAISSTKPEVHRLDRVGLQLYTVRDLMRVSVPWTLEQVASAGYREVEFAGYFGARPAELRRWLEDSGLTAPAAHVRFGQMSRHLDATLDAAAELGHRFVVLPSIPIHHRRSLDRYREAAALLNRAGSRASDRGVSVAYHNHDFEFRPVGGFLPYHIFLNETDPQLVSMEIDFYWMAKAGYDPLRYFEAHPGRFRLCHLKDMDAQGRITDVGEGRIDFAQILAHRERAGLLHYFVEHDNPRNPLASIRNSYAHLRRVAPALR